VHMLRGGKARSTTKLMRLRSNERCNQIRVCLAFGASRDMEQNRMP
jgi:hypothetical protein